MSGAGSALLGIGTGVGEARAQMAARAAVASPLLDLSIEGAKGVLFNICGGPDLTMSDVDEAARIIAEHCDADANIIFGATIDQRLSDQVRITVIATGFDETRARLAQMTNVAVRPQASDIEETNGDMGSREQQEEPKVNESDEFGEKFKIPAFLRQGRFGS